MVTVPVIGAEVVLVAENPETLTVPDATRPMAVLELVHANVAPAGVLTKEFAGTAAPGQNV